MGDPVLLVHGLGGTKVSMLPTVAALAPQFHAISVDLPGAGDSDKPVGAPYDPRFFAASLVRFLDALRSTAPTSSATAWAGGSRSSSACATRSA